MHATYDNREAWDRLVLLLIAQPREGWEDTWTEITRREVERLAPHPEDGKQKGSSPTKTRTPKTLPNQGVK
jgi:hypothetical protein